MIATPPVNATRYAMLIESALAASPPEFVAQAESADAIQVERGIIFPAALLMRTPASVALQFINRLMQPGLRDPSSYAIVDQLGHRRPAYRGLLIYTALQALRLTDGNEADLNDRARFVKLPGGMGKCTRLPVFLARRHGQRSTVAHATQHQPTTAQSHFATGLHPWAEMMAQELAHFVWPTNVSTPLPAARGAAIAGAAWNALALYVASNVYTEARWRDLAAASFNQFAHRQLRTGPFLAAGPADNPETRWYHELVLLHAAASYAIQSGDAALTAAVARNAEFHLAQTQPDHATNQPWGLPAFMLNPSTHPLADQLLHSATALAGAGGAAASGITSILLADALYCLRLLTKPPPTK